MNKSKYQIKFLDIKNNNNLTLNSGFTVTDKA
jgi:hypothetical protein